jgi:hypothetical protein
MRPLGGSARFGRGLFFCFASFTSKLLEPDAAAGVFLDQGHIAKVLFFVKPVDERIAQLNLKPFVVLQKRPEQIGLVPGSAFVNPIEWILKRIEDVVKVYVDAAWQQRQKAKENVIDVAVDL